MVDMHAFNIRLPQDISEQLKAAAESNRRSLNGEVITLLEEAFKARAAKRAESLR